MDTQGHRDIKNQLLRFDASDLSDFTAQSVFHVKRFGTIDGLGKCTSATRRDVRNGDFGQAQFRDRIKIFSTVGFRLRA